jgi:hypothetical protein
MRGQYLRGNAGTRVPSSHVVLDTEAIITPVIPGVSERQTLRLGCAIGWRRDKGRTTRRSVCHFATSAEWWTWLESRLSTHRTTWVWAHNLPYDLSLCDFWARWQGGYWRRKWECLNDPPTIISGWINGCAVMMVDSLNWLPNSLATIGDWLGVPKLDMPAQHEAQLHWEDYCTRDAEILERAVGSVCDFVEHHDLGVMRPTSAGQSMQSYRHRWLWPGLCIPDDAHHKDWERASYYGGRCELYYRGYVRPWTLSSSASGKSAMIDGSLAIAGPVTALDVTGLYCSVLRDQLLPSRVLDRCSTCSPRDLLRAMTRYGAIAEVTLDSHDTPYPVRHGGRTLYAVGRFATTLAGEELRHALECVHVVSIVQATTYQLDPIARNYAEYWAEQREQYRAASDAIYCQLAKSMPNSWAGKWGQQSSRWEDYPDVPAPRPWYRWAGKTIGAEAIDRYQSIAGATQRETRRESAPKSWPAIAAYITCLGRVRMDALRAAAGPRNTLYQCVDTLHCTSAGVLGLERAGEIVPGELGRLRETHTYQSVDYIGINLLRVDGAWHAAGLGRLHRELPNGDCDVTTFERLGSLLCREPDGSVSVTHRSWRPDYRYEHSVVREDGWCEPHRLP